VRNDKPVTLSEVTVLVSYSRFNKNSSKIQFIATTLRNMSAYLTVISAAVLFSSYFAYGKILRFIIPRLRNSTSVVHSPDRIHQELQHVQIQGVGICHKDQNNCRRVQFTKVSQNNLASE
jgi:hypothetical protein